MGAPTGHTRPTERARQHKEGRGLAPCSHFQWAAPPQSPRGAVALRSRRIPVPALGQRPISQCFWDVVSIHKLDCASSVMMQYFACNSPLNDASSSMMHRIQRSLGELARITAGHPIREAVRDVPGGNVAVVQIKNMGADTGIDWPAVARIRLTGRREPDWLKSGDIIFSARGHRNVAVCVDDPPADAVCSPHFFLIRVKSRNTTLPEFVAWQMNLPRAQRYFEQSATGSYITSIRRQVLEMLPLQVPSLEKQRLLVRLARAARLETRLMERLIENRRRELDLVAQELLADR